MADDPDEPPDDEEMPDVEIPDEMEEQVDAAEEAALARTAGQGP